MKEDVGDDVGVSVGECVKEEVGEAVDVNVGELVGFMVGEEVGVRDGEEVGVEVGDGVGDGNTGVMIKSTLTVKSAVAIMPAFVFGKYPGAVTVIVYVPVVGGNTLYPPLPQVVSVTVPGPVTSTTAPLNPSPAWYFPKGEIVSA